MREAKKTPPAEAESDRSAGQGLLGVQWKFFVLSVDRSCGVSVVVCGAVS